MFDIAMYEEARTTEEAISLLQQYPQAHLVAGGTDILIKLRAGSIQDAELIGIRKIASLRTISRDHNGTISIGATATFSEITQHPIIRQYVSVLGQAVETVGGPQIRNMGTIGGNICNGATSADSAATLFALNAQLRIQGLQGERMLPIEDFYLGPGRVALQSGEILTAVMLQPKDYWGFGGQYIKYAMRKAMDIATLGCVVLCKIAADATLEDCRLAFGVAGPTPLRCRKAEAAMIGHCFSPTLAEELGKRALAEVNPRSSWRASKEFRLHLVEELTKRAFSAAYAKAGGTEYGK